MILNPSMGLVVFVRKALAGKTEGLVAILAIAGTI